MSYPSILPFLTEALKVADVNMTQGKKKASIYNGRFQPMTLAHAQIVENMKRKFPDAEPFVFVVKGIGTSEDRTKNPLPFKIQKQIILKSIDNIVSADHVIEVPDSFIGTFINECRNRNYEPVALFCGTDRLKGYTDQVERYKSMLNIDIKIVELKRTAEDVSATKLRQAIKNDDFETFKAMTKNLDQAEFKLLRGALA